MDYSENKPDHERNAFFYTFPKNFGTNLRTISISRSERRVVLSFFSPGHITLIILKSQPGRLKFLAPETFAKFSTQKSVNFELLISMKYLAFPGPLSSTTLTVRQESVADTLSLNTKVTVVTLIIVTEDRKALGLSNKQLFRCFDRNDGCLTSLHF